jgi:hypothetical protein
MGTRINAALGFSIALLAMAGTAGAQGHGKGKGQGHQGQQEERGEGHGKRGNVIVQRAGGDVVVVPSRKVPPGLAKKPGQMPPGQYKKLYSTADGASVLSDIFRRHNYAVTRVQTYGDSRYVYYRAPDGSIRRAIVSPGTSRLSFSNVPSLILQEVLSRLY